MSVAINFCRAQPELSHSTMAKPSEDSQEAPAGQNGAPATAQSEADHGKADDAIVESDTDREQVDEF